MNGFTRRAFQRKQYEAPIRYATLRSRRFTDSIMYNFSANGIYFEPRAPIEPDTTVRIQMVNYAPGAKGLEAYKSYVALIKWCQKLTSANGAKYGIGVQLVARSQDIASTDAMEIQYYCDLCLLPTALTRISAVDECHYLCIDCLEHLSVIPDEAM